MKANALINEIGKNLEKNKYLKKWLNFEITNFDYLMYLNQMSGRGYKDTTQYYIMPWILKNYYSETLNLNDSSNYRALNKTVGALGNDTRIQGFLSKFELIDPFNPVP